MGNQLFKGENSFSDDHIRPTKYASRNRYAAYTSNHNKEFTTMNDLTPTTGFVSTAFKGNSNFDSIMEQYTAAMRDAQVSSFVPADDAEEVKKPILHTYDVRGHKVVERAASVIINDGQPSSGEKIFGTYAANGILNALTDVHIGLEEKYQYYELGFYLLKKAPAVFTAHAAIITFMCQNEKLAHLRPVSGMRILSQKEGRLYFDRVNGVEILTSPKWSKAEEFNLRTCSYYFGLDRILAGKSVLVSPSIKERELDANGQPRPLWTNKDGTTKYATVKNDERSAQNLSKRTSLLGMAPEVAAVGKVEAIQDFFAKKADQGTYRLAKKVADANPELVDSLLSATINIEGKTYMFSDLLGVTLKIINTKTGRVNGLVKVDEKKIAYIGGLYASGRKFAIAG